MAFKDRYGDTGLHRINRLPQQRANAASAIAAQAKGGFILVWMAPALQGKNALTARLVSTVLCPAFDRGVDTCRWP
ncbi:hypothetical protein ETW24_02355 [Leisingera sp. NJS204]|nr:hypothetical protein ETW24_02355 [Leisingera sp. NJS204]